MKRTVPALILILSILLTACAVQSTPTATTVPLPEATPFSGPALFEVVRQDGTRVAFTQDMISAIPEASVTIEGSVQAGPKLVDVLAAAGIGDYTKLVFSGSSILTVEAAQVTDQFILDLSNRGTYKMASPDIPKANWVKDIVSIEVK